MIKPNPNVGSQIERALLAYFFYNWPVPTYARPNLFFSNDWKARQTPLLEALAHKSTENPINSRDEDYIVTLKAEWPGVVQPGQLNPDYNWKQVNDLIGIPMALLSQALDNDQNFNAACMQISAIGRRLAVLGLAWIYGPGIPAAIDFAQNSDMSTFICKLLRYNGSIRVKQDQNGLFLVEERTFTITAFNGTDDSIFPALTFDGVHTLNWTFTIGGITGVEPNYWALEKSADGLVWITQEFLPAGTRTADISATGLQFWRVRPSNDGVTMQDPESNLVKAQT